MACRLVKARSACIYIVDWPAGVLWTLGNNETKQTWPITAGLAGHATRTATPEYHAHAHDDPNYHPEVDLKTSGALLVVPLCDAEGRPLAVLEVTGRPSRYDHHDLTVDDLPPLVNFGTALCASLANAVQYEGLMDANKMQHELLKFMKQLATLQEESAVTTFVRQWLLSNIAVDRAVRRPPFDRRPSIGALQSLHTTGWESCSRSPPAVCVARDR